MGTEGLEKLANILSADTIKKIYEDGLSESVQETGKVTTDFIKAFRLFTSPAPARILSRGETKKTQPNEIKKQTRQNTLFCPKYKSTIRFMSFQIYLITNLNLYM